MGPTLLLLLFETAAPPLLAADAAAAACPRPPCVAKLVGVASVLAWWGVAGGEGGSSLGRPGSVNCGEDVRGLGQARPNGSVRYRSPEV